MPKEALIYGITRKLCGLDKVHTAVFSPRYNNWKLADLLRQLDQLSKISASDKARFVRTLWHDMSAECHADNLCNHLHSLPDFKMSEEFRAFLYRWRIDELKHYCFMRRIYALLTGHSEKLVVRRLREMGPPDFSEQQQFFVDEFTLLVLFAYDEIITTISYGDDRWIYRALGNPFAVKGFNLVIRDEANHFSNAIAVLKRRHKERLFEVPAILVAILSWERLRHDYGKTFLLDRREVDAFCPALFDKACDIIHKQLVV